jgi:chaperonin GroES
VDLDGDGYPEPYIVTVEKETAKVVRVVARFDERGITRTRRAGRPHQARTGVHQVRFIPAPDGSFYDIGFGTLLSPLGHINTVLNQLYGRRHLANLQGGFIGEGVSDQVRQRTASAGRVAQGGDQWRQPEGQHRPAAGEGAVQRPVPTDGTADRGAKDVTATQDILGGDSGPGSLPVGTVSALIEQGLKTFTAIVKRLHRALKKELASSTT